MDDSDFPKDRAKASQSAYPHHNCAFVNNVGLFPSRVPHTRDRLRWGVDIND